MCRQRLDKLTYKGSIFPLKTDPLTKYWTEEKPMPPLGIPNTGNHRGYYSSWEIIDNCLYLIDLSYFIPEGYYAGLTYVFPDATRKIKATWYTGELEVFRSNDIDKIYGELDVPLHPKWVISIENGIYMGQSIKLISDYMLQKTERRLFGWFSK